MAAASASSVNKDMETSMERLSTGKRINSAADDAAGVAIASRLSSEIRGTNQAIRNAQDGQAMLDTAEGAHKEIENILQRMRELAVQAANDTNDSTDRTNLAAEMTQLTTEIDRISSVTTWAGQNLLNGTGGASSNGQFAFQIGGRTNVGDVLSVTINSMTASALGIDGSAVRPEVNITASPTTASGAISLGAVTNADGDITVADAIDLSGGEFNDGDVYSVDINGTAVQITASDSDEYADSVAGLVEQLAAKINDLDIAGVTATADTVNGAVDIDQIANVDTPTTTSTAGTIVVSDGTDSDTENLDKITIGGTVADGDAFTMNINGVAATFTNAAANGYSADPTGTAALIAAEINANSETYGVTATAAAGVVQLKSALSIQNAEVTSSAASTASYVASTGVMTFSAADNADVFTFDVDGNTVSMAVAADGYSNDATGIAAQAKAAIDAAKISGLTVTDNNDGTITLNKGGSVSLTSNTAANSSISLIDNAITTLNTQRANLGAISNRLDNTVSNLTNVVINLEGGKGRIEDADFAAESTSLAKSQILQQASTAMLAQANASKQNVLSLLQG
jgi:flagellin